MVRAVEELEVFRRAYRLSLEVHRFTLRLPRIEQFGLGEQLRRSSKSVCANLAEGFGRQGQSKAEFRRFVQMGIGSAAESGTWLSYCVDLGYLDAPVGERWRGEYQEIGRMLQALSGRLAPSNP